MLIDEMREDVVELITDANIICGMLDKQIIRARELSYKMDEFKKERFAAEYYTITQGSCDLKGLNLKFEEVQEHIRTVKGDAGSIRLLVEDLTEIDTDKIHAIDALAEHQIGYLEHISDELTIARDIIAAACQ